MSGYLPSLISITGLSEKPWEVNLNGLYTTDLWELDGVPKEKMCTYSWRSVDNSPPFTARARLYFDVKAKTWTLYKVETHAHNPNETVVWHEFKLIAKGAGVSGASLPAILHGDNGQTCVLSVASNLHALERFVPWIVLTLGWIAMFFGAFVPFMFFGALTNSVCVALFVTALLFLFVMIRIVRYLYMFNHTVRFVPKTKSHSIVSVGPNKSND